ncbi:hypothetical protein [Streptomyces sp. ME18-1-4]|uniref:hypothetical protein n=1 Tax=Streptomyces sp. ME18-1-4 TaxID=3028685 RepID=UPI0029ADDF98|nr:hypothetical protein [Streptomyces sp. ME18-1-4]MDX3243191.1 hypothetical protein [Streptomyces sp. ME18-1-4]
MSAIGQHERELLFARHELLGAERLAWLSALTRWKLQEDIDEDEYTSTLEPPVPTGLARLTGPQQALADFLHVDPHLLAAAARASGAAPSQAIDKDALAAWIRALPPHEKDTLLLDAAPGTAPQPGPTLLARHRAASLGTAEPSTAARRRSAAELLDAVHKVRSDHTRSRSRPAPRPAEPNSGLARATWTAWPRTPSKPGRTSPT